MEDKKVKPSYILKDGDTIHATTPPAPTVADVALQLNKRAMDEITVNFNSEEVVIRKVRQSFKLNGEIVDGSQS